MVYDLAAWADGRGCGLHADPDAIQRYRTIIQFPSETRTMPATAAMLHSAFNH